MQTRVLDGARRHHLRLPEPADLSDRHRAAPAARRSAPSQMGGYYYTEGGIVSQDGHNRTFDASGQGTIFGSRRRRRGAEAVEGRDRRRRHDPRRHPRLRHQQRRIGEVGFTAPGVDGQASVCSRRAGDVRAFTPTASATSSATAPRRRSATWSRSRRCTQAYRAFTDREAASARSAR